MKIKLILYYFRVFIIYSVKLFVIENSISYSNIIKYNKKIILIQFNKTVSFATVPGWTVYVKYK